MMELWKKIRDFILSIGMLFDIPLLSVEDINKEGVLDERYLIFVSDYQPYLLPRPRSKIYKYIISVESGEDDGHEF